MPAREPEALVLDAMGVLYAEGNLVEAHVIPFARGHGSRLADRDILTAYLRCSAGDMSSAEFWRTVGVTGNATDLDAAYVKLHRLMPGLERFLTRMRAADVRVVVLSNDVSEWSRALRELHGLHEQIDHWTVSGDVRSRKPDEGIYRSLLQATNLRGPDCLFVDDKTPNLDVARDLGFHTGLFAPADAGHKPKPTRDDLDSETFQLGSSTWQDSTHPVARTFDDVAALLNVDAGDGGS